MHHTKDLQMERDCQSSKEGGRIGQAYGNAASDTKCPTLPSSSLLLKVLLDGSGACKALVLLEVCPFGNANFAFYWML